MMLVMTTTGPTITHPIGTAPLVRKLVTEWDSISAKPRALRAVNRWALPGGQVHHLDEVLVRSGYGLEPRNQAGDAVLFSLVQRAASDELAARIVLQRILPPLIAIAGRRGQLASGGFNEALHETIGQAWILIRTYPVDRRPAKVAANLVRDTEYFAFVRGSRLKRVEIEQWVDDATERIAIPEEEPDTHCELNELIEKAIKHGFHGFPLQLITRLSSGETMEEIAAEAGVCVRTVRTWRRKAIIELRERMQYAA
jgi:DNA-directed RNA polymerase specialized sigma24 family protein